MKVVMWHQKGTNMIFENIVGNERNKELLKSIIDANNIAHSYMFVGKESIGKLIFAKNLQKPFYVKVVKNLVIYVNHV